MRRSSDPFREAGCEESPWPTADVEAAALCQRLGLLKQTVDFEGLGQVAVFDPALLHKAQRVLQMETYTEVREMARVLLKNFESLCKVLVHLNDDQVKLELKENGELTAAILRLEQVWADCQFILHQFHRKKSEPRAMARWLALLLVAAFGKEPLPEEVQVHLAVDPDGDVSHKKLLRSEANESSLELCTGIQICNGDDAVDCGAANNGDCKEKYCCSRGKACFQCGGDGFDCSNSKVCKHPNAHSQIRTR
ncbi:unnamed protein product [Effrenium voratum]|nr:unnamed protein product [Effrenium voratum]